MAIFNAEKLSGIVRQCIDNDPKAQKQLFDILSPKMYAICLRYARHSDEAKDILQEGFIKMFKYLDRFEGKGSFEGWVKRIFINTSIEFYRKAQKEAGNNSLDQAENQPFDAQILSNLKVDDLMRIVQELPTGYRTVFNLFVIEGYGHEEIAQMLSISENTSKSQLFKARQHLQTIILKRNLR
ncbi:MAG: RNA polymerase sigma factor [Bacteroidota bacterium]